MAKKYYKEVVDLLISNKGQRSGLVDGYGGNSDPSLHIKIPVLKNLAKKFLSSHKDISDVDFSSLLDKLFSGKYDDEKGFASKLLSLNHQYRLKLHPNKINQWLNTLSGWAQVDCLCQSNFSSKELLANWKTWKKLIEKFSSDKNINKRRASLVLLIRSLREVNNSDLENLAFKNIDKLKQEKDILITKAISWLLREMIKQYRGSVRDYLDVNTDSLPKIAVRETRKKLETGKKSGEGFIRG